MRWAFPTLLTAFVVVFRFAGVEYPELLNVTPLFALFLCFGKELMGYIYIPFLGLLISDIVLNAHYGFPPNAVQCLFTYYALYLTYMVGGIKNIGIISKSVIVTTGFFILTSFVAWLSNPAYGSGFGDMVYAIVIGEPNYPPAYLFYLKSLIGNFGFAFLFDAITKYHLSHDNSLRVLR